MKGWDGIRDTEWWNGFRDTVEGLHGGSWGYRSLAPPSLVHHHTGKLFNTKSGSYAAATQVNEWRSENKEEKMKDNLEESYDKYEWTKSIHPQLLWRPAIRCESSCCVIYWVLCPVSVFIPVIRSVIWISPLKEVGRFKLSVRFAWAGTNLIMFSVGRCV